MRDSTVESFYEDITSAAPSIAAAAKDGDVHAAGIIRLYQMHQRCPNDPGALGLCMAAFRQWQHPALDCL